MLPEKLRNILNSIPDEWRGTTYKNHILVGRSKFAENLMKLDEITTEKLTLIGNAEDYFRVSNNISTLYELVLAQEKDLPVEQVFTFASKVMGIVAVAKASGKKVKVYGQFIHSIDSELLKNIGCDIEFSSQTPVVSDSFVTLKDHNTDGPAHGLLEEGVLYILDSEVINPIEILVVRKRMSTPLTTPVCELELYKKAGLPTVHEREPLLGEVATFYMHLQELCGTPVDTSANPVCFTAGLSTLAAFYIALISSGGADILMASTAYGGSSQLTDLLTKSNDFSLLRKHKFHIQGGNEMVTSITQALEALQEIELLPITVIFCEIPTNPDMKVPDLKKLVLAVHDYRQKTSKKVVLLIDTTFSPNSKILSKLKSLDSELEAVAFISLSKSVSRGKTTAGCLVANHTSFAKELVSRSLNIGNMLDTLAKPDQLLRLVENHDDVEGRLLAAYRNAATIGKVLQEAVLQNTGVAMQLAFVNPEQAADMYTTSTFSFNLPAPAGATAEVTAHLAQEFTDLLCEHKEFKPCVSFGQDNGLIYCTVPATSTQGAISEQDKAKQAVGGVQLVRLSFPPSIDLERVEMIIKQEINKIYTRK